MSISPINILQRLLELKLQQQNRNSPVEKLKTSENVNNETSASDYQTIVGLSAFDTTIFSENTCRKQLNWDSQTIKLPRKTFNELIDQKLSEETNEKPEIVDAKPKRPFLRKGTGLQRFRLNSTPELLKNNKLTPLKAPKGAIQSKTEHFSQPDPIPKINEIARNDLIITVKPKVSDQSLYERALEKELLIFEELEDRANNSSFCSTNSSVLRILSSTPSKVRKGTKSPEVIIEEKRHVRWETESENLTEVENEGETTIISEEEDIESNLEKKDIQAILLRLKAINEAKLARRSESSANSSISSSDFESTIENCNKMDACVGTTQFECGNCRILEEKLGNYNLKMKQIDFETDRLKSIQKDFDNRKIQLEKGFKTKEKEFHEEQDNFWIEIEAERKKLAKEKVTNENLLKEAQNKTNRREREEVTNLKQELADLKETLKLKESKNGMTQARLRNQIKQMEKENGHLKEENAKLSKENAKLNATNKMARRKSSGTDAKILLEINKNVAKLTEKVEEKALVNGGEKIEQKSVGKEGNCNGSMLEMTKFRNCDYFDVEKQYENVFKGEFRPNSSLDDSGFKKTERNDRILDDGSKEIKYNNGNLKTISADGNVTTIKYFNKDIKQTHLLDGVVKYFYFDKNIWQTTYADGSELIEFPDGPKERRYKDGKCEIILPDNVIQIIYPNGNQEIKYTDGSILEINNETGTKILLLPNGQKEIETAEHKRREYPDGTIKILYPDGTQETRYSNGRIRIRNSEGNLVMDTHS